MTAAHAPDDHCDPKRLLELVRRGDASALDQITRCYGARLLAVGRKHCRTVSEAEDAVQDTLLFAATDLQSFRGEGSLEGFLVRIVARAGRKLSRGQKNDASLSLLLSLEPSDRAVLLLAELDD